MHIKKTHKNKQKITHNNNNNNNILKQKKQLK